MRVWRACAVALLGMLALLMPAVAARGENPPPVDGVVLIGAPGLSWSDVDPATTPVLDRLAREGAVASMTVRSVRTRACGVDGWLTLGAGRRAADAPGPCRAPVAVGADGVVPGWQRYRDRAGADGYDARPGTLAERLTASGACVEAVGPGAAIGAADPSGGARVAAAGSRAGGGCPVVLVDGGTLPADRVARTEALHALDGLVAGYLRSAGAGTGIVVAGVGDGPSPIRPRAVLASGLGPGVLTSASTRQPGLVQLQDLTASLLAWSGAAADGLTGRPMTATTGAATASERVADRIAFETRAATMRSVSPQVTGWLAASYVLWCAFVTYLVARRAGGVTLPTPLAIGGVALASVPVGTFVSNLAPWWDSGSPTIVFVAVLALVVVVTTVVAMLLSRRAPLGALLAVSGLTLLVLGGDVLTGSRLQLASVFGQNPIVGGRFYGMGNTSYALFGVATTAVVAEVATSRRLVRARALGAAVVIGLLLAALEGHPSYGADFGGPPGLLLALLVVLALASGVPLTATRAVSATAAVVLVTAGVAVLDWLRPAASRTHLGEFVQTALDGGLGDVVGRKLAQNLTNLGSPPLVAIALATLVLSLVLWRTGRRPSRTSSLVLRGAAVVGVVGFALNDSGLVIPAYVALTLAPLLLARSHDAVERDT